MYQWKISSFNYNITNNSPKIEWNIKPLMKPSFRILKIIDNKY